MNGAMLALLALCLVGTEPADQKTVTASRVQLVVQSASSLELMEIELTWEGKSLTTIWDESFDQLHQFCDRSGDGMLDADEVALLPSPVALRQILWGNFTPNSTRHVSLEEIDANRDAQVSVLEMAAYYRRHGLGQSVVGMGNSDRQDDLHAAMLRALDTSGDGSLDSAELARIETSLMQLDTNDDELLSSSELLRHWEYPGATGTLGMLPPRAAATDREEYSSRSTLLLPIDLQDTHWAALLVSLRDKQSDAKLDAAESGLSPEIHQQLDTDGDAQLTAAELTAWRSLPSPLRWNAELSPNASSPTPRGTLVATDCWIDARVSRGRLSEVLIDAEKGIAAAWARADTTRNKAIDREEARSSPPLDPLFPLLDRNADGELTEDERDAWLALQHQIAEGLALLTIIDTGRSLFNQLDTNCDGDLSRRELRRWSKVFEQSKSLRDGTIQLDIFPRKLFLVASQGKPIALLEAREPARPTWHRGMDRNHDGDVSRREFVGPLAKFDELDADHDGLISAAEAGALE